MAIEAGFDASELDELTRQMFRIAEEHYPKQAQEFLRDQGKAGKNLLKRVTKSNVKGHRKRATKAEKKTALLKGIDKGPVRKFNGDWQVRVHNNANHAHLIEHGHSNIKTKSSSQSKGKIPIGTPVVVIPGRNGPIFIGKPNGERKIPGVHPGAKTTKKLKEQFPREVEKFVDDLIKEGFEL